MFKIDRKTTQIISSITFLFGILQFLVNQFEIGAVFTGIAMYIMLFSESVFLQKIQAEMGDVLEKLRKKQSVEIQELLYFLRSSKLGSSPHSSIEAATRHIKKIKFPAIITDSGGACIALNSEFTDKFGYDDSWIGELCHKMQTTDRYGEYVQGISTRISAGNRYMHSRLTMVSADGTEYPGTVSIIMLPDLRTAIGIFYPDEDGILT